MPLKLTDFNESGLEDIPLSTPVRVTHRGCSDKANATVTRTPLGWLMHCFKCDERGFKYARVGKLSTAETYAPKVGNLNPPTDIVPWSNAVPADLQRFVDYGINSADVRMAPIGWSMGARRLMFPLAAVTPTDAGVYVATKCKSYAGKIHPKATDSGLKWIVYKHDEDKDKPLVFCHGHGLKTWDRNTLVLCEDPISALKIAGNGTGFAAIALLGLSLPQELLVYLAAKKVDVIVWPDGDAPGMKRGRGIYDQLKFLKGNTYLTYVKGKDPKDLTTDQIRDHIASVRKETNTVA